MAYAFASTAPSAPISAKFPKSARILSRGHYKHLHKNAKRLAGNLVYIDYRTGRSFVPKLGITVSRKFGKAHERNRFKRLVREAFRELYGSLPRDLEINIAPRKKPGELRKQMILLELKCLLANIHG